MCVCMYVPAPLATAESNRVMGTMLPATMIPAATKDRRVSASSNVAMT